MRQVMFLCNVFEYLKWQQKRGHEVSCQKLFFKCLFCNIMLHHFEVLKYSPTHQY